MSGTPSLAAPGIHVPLPVPTHLTLSPRELSEQERSEYDRVLAHFSSSEYVLPGVPSEKASLMDEERMWLSYECMLRYLRAAKHNVAECTRRLEDTLKWRREYGLYDTLTAALVEPEAVTGKQFLFGYDTHGKPGFYMCPSKQNTEEGPRQIQHVVWMLERAIDLMGPGVETLALLIDYADKSKNTSLTTARQVLHILQTHYPERLGAALIAHLPWLLRTFYKIITPFVDPVTRAKMIFDPVTNEHGLWRSEEARTRGDSEKEGEPSAKVFDLDQLVRSGWEGSQEFTYKHDSYWPALVEMCETRRKEMAKVWRELGGTVGIKEWDVKVGMQNVTGATEKIPVDDEDTVADGEVQELVDGTEDT